ncbi:MAG: MarR family winged helix-turn-helix transcriptional regulator [Pseudomonadota bacterium]
MNLETIPAPCVCTTIRKAGRALLRRYEAAVASTGVTITQFALLRALERNGPMPLSRLADEMVMERTSLYRTLEPLVATAAVAVEQAPVGRSKVASLTAEGSALIEQVLPHWAGAQRQVVDRIGADAWRALAASLLEIPELLETKP